MEMTQPFLAMIIPVGSGGGGPPLGTWGGVAPPYVDIGGPGPQPPGSPGQPPLGFWGGRPPNYVDIGGPTPQPPWGAHPSHPIWRPDLGFWGGRPPPYVDTAPPGSQPRPEHPIYFPPPGSPPPLGIWGPPQMPPGYWGGGMGPGVKPQPHPEHPIVLPPDLPPEIPPEGEVPATPIDWKVGWTPQTGWIVIGVPSGPHVTPSSKS
jgi:hypothetical protein